MKVVRTIASILVGLFVGGVAVGVTENIGHLVYPPPEEGAFLFVLLAWQVGAVLGGATAALAAPGGRVIHAGVIGVFILFASVGAMRMIPHPEWMKIAGLLLPLPMSLLAGKAVSLLTDAPAEPAEPPSDP